MKLKRTISSVLAVLTMLSCTVALFSCGRQKNDGDDIASLPKTKRTSVYNEVSLETGNLGANYISNMFSDGENLIMKYETTYTVVKNENGEEIERFEGYYYEYGGGVYEDVAVAYSVDGSRLASSAFMPAPVSNESEASDEPRERLDGEEDEFGVIIDDNRNIDVPDGWFIDWTSETTFASMPISGGEVKKCNFDFRSALNAQDENGEEVKSDGYVSEVFLGNDGTVSALYQIYNYNYDLDMDEMDLYILTLDLDKKEIVSQKHLNDCFEAAGINDGYVWINRITTGSDGNYYFSIDDGLYAVDGEMNFIKKYDIGDGYVSGIVSMGEKTVVVQYNSNWSGLCVKIIENGEITDAPGSIDDIGMYGVIGGYGDRIYFSSNTGVQYYDVVTGECGEELNYINSDIDFTNINDVVVVGDGKLISSTYDWRGDYPEIGLSLCTRVPDEEIPEEVILTIGSLYMNYSLVKSVMEFNKKGSGVRFSIKTYEQYNNEENEYNGATTQMNNEIVSGSLPDILALSSSLPVQSYFTQGVFVDLNKYIDDPEKGIDRADYLDNVFRANETNGKLYSVITDYYVSTLAAKSEYVGNESGWTLSEMMEAVRNMPDGMRAFYNYSRDDLITLFFSGCLSSFVDWETGDTKFNSPEFVEFLNYLKTCPEKDPWSEYYESVSAGGEYVYDEDAERELREKVRLQYWNDYGLFSSVSISSIDNIRWTYNEFASKDITFIGYPTYSEDGNGAFITPTMELAISAKSKAKDLAWSFIKSLLEENNEDDYYSLSVNRKQLDFCEAKFKEQIENDRKNTEETDDDYYEWMHEYGYSDDYINFSRNSNLPLDEDMIALARSIIENADTVVRGNDELIDVINEELSSFFAGTKSAEDAARIIASRARIIISEKS